jgi:hypothetical protein
LTHIKYKKNITSKHRHNFASAITFTEFRSLYSKNMLEAPKFEAWPSLLSIVADCLSEEGGGREGSKMSESEWTLAREVADSVD